MWKLIGISIAILLLKVVPASAEVSVIPRPKSMHWDIGTWIVPRLSTVCYDPAAATSVKWLRKLVGPLTKTVATEMSLCKQSSWKVNLDANLKYLGDEGYRLKISRAGVSLASSSEVGLFYAIQTLRQLLPPELEISQSKQRASLQFVEIEDAPFFSWRGSMFDVARSFYSVEYMKHHIERMALFKLNRLHLHLTDDQGWRIEIKKYPNLTKHGGSGSVKDGAAGFYTQAQFKELQKYASDRYITIIPEIEMPGHVYAALSSYPELNCKNFENLSPRRATPPELYRGVRVKWNSLCLEKPEVKAFVFSVLQEISEITSGPWIHIGGDEAEAGGYDAFMSIMEREVYKLGKSKRSISSRCQASGVMPIMTSASRSKSSIDLALGISVNKYFIAS